MQNEIDSWKTLNYNLLRNYETGFKKTQRRGKEAKKKK